MFKGQTTIVIQASPEAIYKYLVDFRRHPEWAQNLSKVTLTSEEPIKVGTTFKTQEGPPPVKPGTKLKMMLHFLSGVLSGAKPYSEARITALEPNRRIAWEAWIPKSNQYFSFVEWEIIIEPQGTASRLTQQFRYDPPDPGGKRMIGAAGVSGLESAMAVNLAHLKHHLEQSNNHRS